MGLLAESGAVGFTDGLKRCADAQVMRRALTYARSFDALVDPASGGAGPRRRRRHERGRARHAPRPSRHPGRRRGDDDRARPAPGRADRRALPRRACLDRRRGRCDPQGEAGRPARHLRHRPALFRAERDRDRRLPHLRQALAAAARRGGPARRSPRASPTAPSTASPATTRRTTRRASACPSPRPSPASIGLETLLPLALEPYHKRRDVADRGCCAA